MRDGPSRNDPEFERAVIEYASPFLRRFRRRAVLTKTAAGSMQMARLHREQHDTVARVRGNEAPKTAAPAKAKTKTGSTTN